MWMDTRYEPGTVTVVAYDAAGTPSIPPRCAPQASPTIWWFTADRDSYVADGRDMAFINVLSTSDGNSCPDARRK